MIVQPIITKIFNFLLVSIVVILILMSILALISVHATLWHTTEFSFSPGGINVYLSSLGEYKELFAATIATIASYFGLWRYKAAVDQNRDKLKMDRYSDWKTVLDIRFIEIEKYDPIMKREFVRIRYQFFDKLYRIDFNISNKEQLIQIFDSTFKNLVAAFEDLNIRNIGMGGVHPTVEHSYSFQSFLFLFLGSVDVVYSDIIPDLTSLYVTNLPNGRTVDEKMYELTLRNYKPLV